MPRPRRPTGPGRASGSAAPEHAAAPATRPIAAILTLGIAIALAYSTSLGTGFTGDGDAIIRRADRVHELRWTNVAQILSTDYWWPWEVTGVYRPITTLSFLLNWSLLGNADRPLGYLLTNLALHWLNASLVLVLATTVVGLTPAAGFFVALLFAIHPVATEAVTNLVGRADLLATAAVLTGLLLHATANRAHGTRRLLLRAGVGCAALAGLLCKESAIALLGVLPLHDLVFAGDARTLGRDRPLRRAPLWERWWPLVAALLAVGLLRAWVFHATPARPTPSTENFLVSLDPWTARLTAVGQLGRTLALLLWPVRLCPDYAAAALPPFSWRLDSFDDWVVPASFGLLVLAAIAVVRGLRRAPAFAFFGGFFLLAWFPTSNLVLLIGAAMAERFLYLPLVGFCGCLTITSMIAAARVEQKPQPSASGSPQRARLSRPAMLALTVVALAYGLRTARRNLDWHDDATLYGAAVATCPESHRAEEGLAAALFRTFRNGDAGSSIGRVVELQRSAVALLRRQGIVVPSTTLEPLGRYELGRALAARDAGASPEAVAAVARDAADALTEAVARNRDRPASSSQEISPEPSAATRRADGPGLYAELAYAERLAGRPERALDALLLARTRAPEDPDLELQISDLQQSLGRSADALESVRRARRLAPERADIAAAAALLERSGEPVARDPSTR